ncbi:helix-turn-helix domain-containing protein [Maricaulis sp.]|uniref:GlxA family transcriptional regulator n=1 Tax=unclassified Maricaulis TaxID=2632371 RepID=UPI001B282CD0|nr:helix-turn-helix domain-containing protein [Maricaulis sp.]MBO6795883.1 helix-turn-helix domain-containing protein [Maricaulis sp.]
MSSSQTIAFLIYPGFQLLDLAGPVSVFAGANRALGRDAYALRILSGKVGPVTSSAGLAVEADGDYSCALPEGHTLLAIGGEVPEIDLALEDVQLTARVKSSLSQASRVGSVCTGAFILAAADILAGHRVTTHWWDSQKLANRHPDIAVDTDAIYIQSGKIWTSAGVTAGIDLALALVELDHGRDIALTIARHLVVPRMRSGGQSQFSTELDLQMRPGTRLGKLCEAIRRAPSLAWSVDTMSETAGISRRTLSRLCREELNISPAALVERLRIDTARRALVETDQSVTLIANEAGFGSCQRLDRAFARQLGVSPVRFRERFRSPYSGVAP